MGPDVKAAKTGVPRIVHPMAARNPKNVDVTAAKTGV
jgi:hypothetical protein